MPSRSLRFTKAWILDATFRGRLNSQNDERNRTVSQKKLGPLYPSFNAGILPFHSAITIGYGIFGGPGEIPARIRWPIGHYPFCHCVDDNSAKENLSKVANYQSIRL